MMVIPVKWIPYILTLGGIIGLLSGNESVGFSLFMIAAGGIWLYFRHAGNTASGANTQTSDTQENAKNTQNP